MNAKIIDGKALAQSVRAGLKEKVEQFKLSSRAPGLTVILVGDNPASQVYVRNKIKACSDVGITSKLEKLPAETSEAELLALLEQLNADDSVDGILVQLPLPRHINEQKVIETIRADKDVDGFHVARRFSCYRHRRFPQLHALRRHQNAGVCGLSPDWRPCFSHRKKQYCRGTDGDHAAGEKCHCHGRPQQNQEFERARSSADVIVAAVGKEKVVTADMVKPGAAVIDVGMNRNAEGKLCGDVDTEEVAKLQAIFLRFPAVSDR